MQRQKHTKECWDLDTKHLLFQNQNQISKLTYTRVQFTRHARVLKRLKLCAQEAMENFKEADALPIILSVKKKLGQKTCFLVPSKSHLSMIWMWLLHEEDKPQNILDCWSFFRCRFCQLSLITTNFFVQNCYQKVQIGIWIQI